jgi:hypothetical protein
VEGKELKQKFTLKKNNKILSFNYTINNNTPKIFDIIEYNLNFQSILKENLKLKSISLLFSNPDRNKVIYYLLFLDIF